MDAMVRELLDLSKLEAGLFQFEAIRVNLCEAVDSVVNRFSSDIHEKGITITSDCDASLFVLGDNELLQCVLNNYISNAIDHIGGEKQIKIKAEKIGDRNRVSVYNTGNSIPEDKLENIWGAFYRGDKESLGDRKGYGLGLAIVKLIAKLHGAVAGVDNVAEGVEFFIELP